MVSGEGLTQWKSTDYALLGGLQSNQVHDQGYEELAALELKKAKTIAFIYREAFGVQQDE